MHLSDCNYMVKSLISSFKLKKNKFDNKKIESVCIILINIGIGDAIMATSFIHALSRMNVSVDVIITKKNIDIFTENTDIRNIFIVSNDNDKIKSINYDLVVDPYSHCGWYFTYKYIKVIKEMKFNYLSGFNVRFSSKYNDNYIAKNGIHITDYYNHLLNKFYNKNLSGRYIINYSQKQLEKANSLINSIEEKTIKIALCPFASTLHKSFNTEQVNKIIAFLNEYNVSVILFCEKEKIKNINGNFYFFECEKFIESSAILSLCDFVISVDTSFVHASNSQNLPLLAFYSSIYNDGYNGDFLCAPNYEKATQVICSNGARNIEQDKLIAEIKNSLNINFDLDIVRNG